MLSHSPHGAPQLMIAAAEKEARVSGTLENWRFRLSWVLGDLIHGRDRPRGPGDVLGHWLQGRRYGYPVCCIAHFCWDNALNRAADMDRWKQIHHNRNFDGPVPCGIFHAGGSPYSARNRMRRILQFEWQFLQTPAVSLRQRALTAQGGPPYQEASVELRQWAEDHRRLEQIWSDDGDLDPELDWA
ncbi:MAG: hypothetical protein U0R52_07610 [Solirubrobacterales bacterium]